MKPHMLIWRKKYQLCRRAAVVLSFCYQLASFLMIVYLGPVVEMPGVNGIRARCFDIDYLKRVA